MCDGVGVHSGIGALIAVSQDSVFAHMRAKSGVLRLSVSTQVSNAYVHARRPLEAGFGRVACGRGRLEMCVLQTRLRLAALAFWSCACSFAPASHCPRRNALVLQRRGIRCSGFCAMRALLCGRHVRPDEPSGVSFARLAPRIRTRRRAPRARHPRLGLCQKLDNPLERGSVRLCFCRSCTA